jgi:selenocysteine lyase/cysteine desulfurase
MPIDRRSFMTAAASLATAAALGPDAVAAESPCVPDSDDPLGVRKDFPIMTNRTYLNSAYSSPIPRQVLRASQAFNERRMLEPFTVGGVMPQVAATRARFAKLVGASADEIGMLFSTTEGENVVANAIDWRSGDNVVVDDLHYGASFVIYRQLQKRLGVELRIVPSKGGAATASDYEPFVDRRTRLVSVAWVSSVNGYRHDMKAIAEVAHAHGALLYADAIQAVGMFPIDLANEGIDILCCGTYKWVLGGFGLAPFYVRKSVQDRIHPDRFGLFSVAKSLPDHQYELREGMAAYTYATLPFAEVMQLDAGLEYVERVGVARIEEHLVGLARQLKEGLLKQGYTLLTPLENRSAIVTVRTKRESKELGEALAKARIDVTVRESEVRVSPGIFNTSDDVERLLRFGGGL